MSVGYAREAPFRFPFIFCSVDVKQVSIVNNVNTSIGNTSVGEKEYTLYGKSSITEILRGLTFQISANSFFQTNTHQVILSQQIGTSFSVTLKGFWGWGVGQTVEDFPLVVVN